ncbi:MAG: hypothetical protein AAB511_02995 [Patescibacteria group bacterium]
MEISRELAIRILKYLDEHKDFYFPFLVMNQEDTPEDNDFVEIEPNEWEMIAEDDVYQTFQLWENLKHLDERTTKLLAKGFIEEITDESLEKAISGLAKGCKKYYKKDGWFSLHKALDYGDNEFIGGKAEAFEDCLELIKEFRN